MLAASSREAADYVFGSVSVSVCVSEPLLKMRKFELATYPRNFAEPEQAYATPLFPYLKLIYAMHNGIPEPTSLGLWLTDMTECSNVTCAKIIYVNGNDFVDETGIVLYLDTAI